MAQELSSQRKRVLKVLTDADEPISYMDAWHKIKAGPLNKDSDTKSGISGTLSYLSDNGYAKIADNEDRRYKYEPTKHGEMAIESASLPTVEDTTDDADAQDDTDDLDNDEQDSGQVDLLETFTDDVPEGPDSGRENWSEESERLEIVERRLEALEAAISDEVVTVDQIEERLSDLTERLSENDTGGDEVDDGPNAQETAATDGRGDEVRLSLPIADSSSGIDHADIIYELPSRIQVREYLSELFEVPRETGVGPQTDDTDDPDDEQDST